MAAHVRRGLRPGTCTLSAQLPSANCFVPEISFVITTHEHLDVPIGSQASLGTSVEAREEDAASVYWNTGTL